MSSTSNKISDILFSSDVLIVASTPFAAYLITFIYEAGFGGVFGMPLNYIELNIGTVFGVAASIYLLVLYAFLILLLIFLITPSSLLDKKTIRTRILALVPLFLSMLIHIHLFGSSWKKWIAPAIVFVSVAIAFFLVPLIRKEKSYLAKLEASDAASSFQNAFIQKILGGKFYYYVYCVFVSLIIIHAAGQSEAMKKEEFFVPASKQNNVVLRLYGKKVICAPFDRTKKTVERAFVIRNLNEKPHLLLRLEKVGPLIIKKDNDNITKTPMN